MENVEKNSTTLYTEVATALDNQRIQRKIKIEVICKPYVINIKSCDEENVTVLFKKYKEWDGDHYENRANKIKFKCPREELEASSKRLIDKAIQEMDGYSIKKRNIRRMKEDI